MPCRYPRVAALLLVGLCFAPHSVMAEPADRADPAEQRARATLAQMTPDEKKLLIHGNMPIMIARAKRPADAVIGAGYVAGVARLGIPPQLSSDASLGISNLMDVRKGDVATALPSGMALAATWNPDLARESGRMIGAEARAKGFNVLLAGGVNLVRDPRGGRNFEYLGEDPLLAGRMVAASIGGIQSNRIIATIKHFALNDQETGRATASVDMDEAAMRESDLLAFRIGITEGRPGSVMCAYNKVGGTYACENRFLLTDVLRRDWGYRGYVMSDWGAVHSTEALHAGLDQQSGEGIDAKRWFSTELPAALTEHRVTPGDLDTAVSRILWSIEDNHLGKTGPVPTAIDYDADANVALASAREAIVLMKNAHDLLPLKPATRSILVVGGHGDLGVPSGGGSSQVVPVGGFRKVESLKQGAAAMFSRRAWGGATPVDGLRAAFPGAEIRYLDGSDPAAAASAARAVDAVVVLAEKFSTEAQDNADLGLGDGQDALIDAVASANPRTIVVLETGNAVVMPWLAKVPAVLSAWYGGQRGGTAIGEVIAGTVNPSGRLPVTFPQSLAQLPNPVLPGSDLPPLGAKDRIVYGVNANSPPFTITYPEGSDAGYRWFDRKGETPIFAFGEGLSYTRFAYSGLSVRGGKSLTVRFTVTNTGSRPGADVPQIYVTLAGKARRLVGWAKPQLQPGESRSITLVADPLVLASFDTARQRWITAPGTIRVELSRSATDLVLTAQTSLSAASYRP